MQTRNYLDNNKRVKLRKCKADYNFEQLIIKHKYKKETYLFYEETESNERVCLRQINRPKTRRTNRPPVVRDENCEAG